MGKTQVVAILLAAFLASAPASASVGDSGVQQREKAPAAPFITSAPLETVTYDLAPRHLFTERNDHLRLMGDHLVEVLRAMLFAGSGESSGSLAVERLRYDRHALTVTITDLSENHRAVESLLACLDETPSGVTSSDEPGTSITKTIRVEQETGLGGLRLRLLRVNANNYADPGDDTAELVARTATTAEDLVLAESQPVHLESYRITAHEVEPDGKGIGEGTVRISIESELMGPRGTVSGTVRDCQKGSPVVGANVFFDSRPTTSVVTGRNGEFRMGQFDGKPVRMTIEAPGYRREVALAYPAARAPMEISLWEGHTLRGRVVDEQGRPVEGATVEVPESPGTTARTDRDGYYLLCRGQGESWGNSLPDITVYPRVTHPDFAPAEAISLVLHSGRYDTVKDFVLKRGAVVSGRVTAQEDGRPLEGVTIRVGRAPYGAHVVIPETTTGRDGRYRFTSLTSGEQYVHALGKDRAPGMVVVSLSSTTETPADFELGRGKPVGGRVVDNKGRPVAGARVSTGRWRGTSMFQRETLTAADGAFRLEHMPDEPVGISVWKEGYGGSSIPAASGGQRDLLTTLSLPIRIGGRVIDSTTGKPLRSFKLLAGHVRGSRQAVSWNYWTEKAIQNDRGEFDSWMQDVAPRGVKFRVRVPGYISRDIEPVLMPGDSVAGLEVRLQKGAAFRGTVIDSQGCPVKGARVQSFSRSEPLSLGNTSSMNFRTVTETETDGSFELADPLEQGRSIYAVHPEKGGGFALDLTGETTSVSIRLEPFGALEGFLYRGERPAGQQKVVVLGDESTTPGIYLQFDASTDSKGYFRFEGLPGGSLTLAEMLEAQQNFTSYARQTPVRIRPSETTFASLGGEGGSRVSGVVKDEEGRPLAGLQVMILGRRGRGDFGTTTGADGRYEIFDVPPGKFTINAVREAYEEPEMQLSARKNLQLGGQAEVECDLVARKPKRRQSGIGATGGKASGTP